MARYTGPKSRIARKFGEGIFGADKVLSKKNYPPGQHGNSRKRKTSEYGVQLREKQKAKYTYGVLEKQFRNLFEKAATAKGITGEVLLQLLEIRKGLLYSMAIAAAIHVVLLVLSALLSRPLKLDAVEQVNVIYSNAAALVIPLVKALMGDAYVIYSCAFIIVQLVLLWTHASSLLQGSSALDWKKVLTNINMIAIAAGALLYWFRVVLPAPLQNTMSTVGNMMGPMGMLLAGMAIAEKPLREVFCTRRNYLPTVLRLVVCPLVVLVLLWVCHASSWVADGKNILMTVYLAAITPACATVTSMAQLYDRDAAHSSALYVLTTLLSIVSMPVMIGLFDLLL